MTAVTISDIEAALAELYRMAYNASDEPISDNAFAGFEERYPWVEQVARKVERQKKAADSA